MLTVAITVSPGTLPLLPGQLHRLGLEVRKAPLLGFEAPRDWSPLAAALNRLEDFSAVVLTSPRAAGAVADLLTADRRTRPLPVDPNREVWVTGRATADALQRTLEPIRLPAGEENRSATAAQLATAMLRHGVGSPVLYPCGDQRRDILPALLGSAGVTVHETVAYRTVIAGTGAALEACQGADIVLVGSPRVAQLLAGVTSSFDRRPALVAIGPVTARAARAYGWKPAAIATAPTEEAVGRAIRALAASLGGIETQ